MIIEFRHFAQFVLSAITARILIIRKTRLYNSDPLKPHFYLVKLGFTGVYIMFFLIYAQNIDFGSFEAVLTCTYNLCFEQKYENCQNCLSENFLLSKNFHLSENFQFLVIKFSVYFNKHVFRNVL